MCSVYTGRVRMRKSFFSESCDDFAVDQRRSYGPRQPWFHIPRSHIFSAPANREERREREKLNGGYKYFKM